MVKGAFKQLNKLPVPLPIVFRPPAQALRSITSKDGLGVYASADTLYKGAVFGRDSLEVAEDLMALKPKLVRKILITMAALQGQVTNKANEEEPGKIIHEYRRLTVDGELINGASRRIFGQLANRWGGTEDELAYYGSVDSTPHFIRVLGRFWQLHDPKILDATVALRDGRTMQMGEALGNSLDWLLAKLSTSKSGLLEYKRLNENGIANQVWKDSAEFYVHTNGQPANHKKPIASIEVQALAYDALHIASDMLPAKHLELIEAAEKIQKQVFELLWMPRRDYFALGLDYDERDHARQLSIITANPAEMLDSTFFDNLGDEDKQTYISAVVNEIMSVDFLTDAGIRSRGLSEAELIEFWDYHGSFTSWPKETFDIAKGLRRQGFPKLAVQLEDRILNVIRAVRSYPEFVYVDRAGRVLGTASAARTHGELVFVESSNRPEKIQAWTVSAVMEIAALRKRLVAPPIVEQSKWQQELEADVLRRIPLVHRLRSRRELSARYPSYPYELTRR